MSNLEKYFTFEDEDKALEFIYDHLDDTLSAGNYDCVDDYLKACMNNPNGLYFIAAPTYQQVKKIYWQDMKKLCLTSLADKDPSESNLVIFFNNGS